MGMRIEKQDMIEDGSRINLKMGRETDEVVLPYCKSHNPSGITARQQLGGSGPLPKFTHFALIQSFMVNDSSILSPLSLSLQPGRFVTAACIMSTLRLDHSIIFKEDGITCKRNPTTRIDSLRVSSRLLLTSKPS